MCVDQPLCVEGETEDGFVESVVLVLVVPSGPLGEFQQGKQNRDPHSGAVERMVRSNPL